MATYKPYRKISSTEKEEIRIPYSVLVDTPNLDEYTKRASDETITGTWTYSTAPKMDTLKNSKGDVMYHFNSSRVFFGQTTFPTTLRGSLERPQYTTDGTTFQDIALKSDIVETTSVAEEVTIPTSKWQENSSISPFALKATMTLNTTMNVNSVVSLGYKDALNMKRCAGAGVVIGEVPSSYSGRTITFYAVTKPSYSLQLVVNVEDTVVS